MTREEEMQQIAELIFRKYIRERRSFRWAIKQAIKWADEHPKNPFNDMSEGILPKEDAQNPSYSIPVLVKEENGYLHTDRYRFNIDAWEEAVSEVVAWAEIPQSWI